MSRLLKLFLIFLPSVLPRVDGDSLAVPKWCLWSKDDLSDMEYIEPYIVNKIKYAEFNSTLGKYVGYTSTGVRDAEVWNKDTADLAGRKAQVETVCKPNAEIYYRNILSKSVQPQVKVRQVKKTDGPHPARLVCSAYSFFPPHIEVTWMRNGKKVEGDVTSTEELADGDWYYQVHSDLEYTPVSGEEISCVVEHASFQRPMEYKWDPSMSEGERSKVAIGASGLVLGIILSAAGFIYYKKKASGRILVPT